MNDILEDLTPVQRKLIQKVKDSFDENNNKGFNDGYVFGRLIKGPDFLQDQPVFQILGNTISSNTNNLLLTPLDFTLKYQQQQRSEQQQEEQQDFIIEIESIKSNEYSLNEKLKATKLLRDIECKIPAKDQSLEFYITLANISTIKTIGIRFKDGNIASYKFGMVFMDENGNILSEIKGQRTSRVTSLMEFYELENKVENVQRIVFTIYDKHNEFNLNDDKVQISDFILTNDVVSPQLVEAKLVSLVNVENKASQYNYLNHPSLLKLRIATNQVKYPMLYEVADSVSFDISNKNYDKYLRIHNNTSGKVINTLKDEPILLSITNPNTSRFDDNIVNSLTTILKKGCMKYGGYKNRFIAFKMIPMQIDDDSWSIDFVTRGSYLELENQDNLYHAIVQIHKEGFCFSRQLINGKSDDFMDEFTPAFPIKLKQDEEIDIILYQFNLNETDVQYFIYVKVGRDDLNEWKLYNTFIDSPKLKGENYGTQSVSWGGLVDYIFFNGISKMELIDITLGELREPIRKIE